MEQALVGTSLDTVPAPLNNALASLRKRFGDSPEITAFALRLNSIDGLADARKTAAGHATPLPRRLATVKTLAELHDPDAAPLFVDLATDPGSPPELRHAALNSLRRYLTPGVTQGILTLYPTLAPGLQRTAASVLSGHPASALALLKTVDAGKIPHTALAFDILLAIQNLADPTIGDLIKKLYGTLRQPAGAKIQRIAEIKKLLADNPGRGEPAAGAKLFANSCAVCHQFRGTGRDIAPDLTGYEMSNTDFLLTSIVDPNLGVREEFELSTLTLHPTSPDTPATVLSGFVTTATDTSVTLKDLAGNTTTTGRSDIANLTRSAVSVMPEGLLDALTPRQTLDLLAFLQSPAAE
ncbi:MAG: c-type cytochrome [Verrucomicrobiales bacterium]|nr:c-type cytochrome [Verrucomicrobiales bacterium]